MKFQSVFAFPTSTMWRSTFLRKTLFSSLSSTPTLLLFAFRLQITEPILFLFVLPSSRNLFVLGSFNCNHPLWDSNGSSDFVV